MLGCQGLQLLQTHLDLDLTLDYETGTLQGTSEYTLHNAGPEPTQSIPMQLGRLMQIRSVRGRDNQPLPFTQDIVTYEDCPQFQVNQVIIDTTAPLLPAHDFSVSMAYSGFLVGYTEVGWRYVRDHIGREFTILRTDALAFPRIGLPSMVLGKSIPRIDFTFAAQITVPSDLTVVTGVAESERIEHSGQTTWVFEAREPVPFLNISIAQYHVVAEQGVRVFHFEKDALGARRLLAAVRQTFGLYERWFGPLGKELKLHIVEIPEGWGSQASLTGGIILTADSFSATGNLMGIYHELAHLWHPDDLDRPAPRWYEGLAMFLQHRVAEELDGRKPLEDHVPYLVGALTETLQQESKLLSVPMAEYGGHLLTDCSYSVGQLMFWVLFNKLGRQEFEALLGGYFRAYRESGSTTSQFVEYLSTHARIDLRPLFNDWMYTPKWANRLISGENPLV